MPEEVKWVEELGKVARDIVPPVAGLLVGGLLYGILKDVDRKAAAVAGVLGGLGTTLYLYQVLGVAPVGPRYGRERVREEYAGKITRVVLDYANTWRVNAGVILTHDHITDRTFVRLDMTRDFDFIRRKYGLYPKVIFVEGSWVYRGDGLIEWGIANRTKVLVEIRGNISYVSGELDFKASPIGVITRRDDIRLWEVRTIRQVLEARSAYPIVDLKFTLKPVPHPLIGNVLPTRVVLNLKEISVSGVLEAWFS